MFSWRRHSIHYNVYSCFLRYLNTWAQQKPFLALCTSGTIFIRSKRTISKCFSSLTGTWFLLTILHRRIMFLFHLILPNSLIAFILAWKMKWANEATYSYLILFLYAFGACVSSSAFQDKQLGFCMIHNNEEQCFLPLLKQKCEVQYSLKVIAVIMCGWLCFKFPS